jgi:hypothetical protein
MVQSWLRLPAYAGTTGKARDNILAAQGKQPLLNGKGIFY